MRTRRIGSLEVSLVGLGCNNFGRRVDADGTRAVVDAAMDAGVTFFDTADAYGDGASEELLGRALVGRRDEVVIATKFGMGAGDEGFGRPEYVREAVGRSLERLGTDHIDLYQLHQPDPATPIDETLGALRELVEAGTVREIGHSNLDGDQIREAEAMANKDADRPRFVSAQNRWSLLTADIENDVVPACAELGLVILPFFPLESGVLTGKYRPGEPAPEGSRLAGVAPDRAQRFTGDGRLETAARLQAWAEERGHTLLELAMSWLAAHPVTASVIAGATRPDQVRQNAAAIGWQLSDAERAEVDAITGRQGPNRSWGVA
jgi:aryl-alcohol dehydrogenase-like predicted oxidoreductase